MTYLEIKKMNEDWNPGDISQLALDEWGYFYVLEMVERREILLKRSCAWWPGKSSMDDTRPDGVDGACSPASKCNMVVLLNATIERNRSM